MEVTLKLGLPDTLDALVKANPGALCSAIERAVIKTLSREVRASIKIAFEGEDFNDDNQTEKEE